jgi:two-component system, NarL family, nitrate/nitrite response regulator NarL
VADRISVILADDHPVYRGGLRDTLKRWPEIEVVGSCADGREALAMIREREPDVALLDIRMPELDALGVLNAVTRDELPTKICLLSAEQSNESVYAGLGSGARGFLSKDASGDEIAAAIMTIARGGTALDPRSQTAIAEGVRLRAGADHDLLTEREREVLRLTADGLSASELGERIHLSPSTVKTHLQHIYEKLGVRDRAAAVAEGMRRGIVE